MNDILKQVIDNNVPRFNKDTTEGSASAILKTAPDYLDSIFKSAIKSLTIPKSSTTGVADLEYIGYRRLTPIEEYTYMSRNRRSVYDLSRTDITLFKLTFKYKGEEVDKFIYLPFAGPGNIFYVSQTAYTIPQVLSDSVISPNGGIVFVRLLKDKISYKRMYKNIIVDGMRCAKSVIYADILRTKVSDHIGKPLTSPSLYLCGKYGLREVVRRYYKDTEVIVTTDNVDHLRTTHHVYESTKIKPRGLKTLNYVGHDLKLVISKEAGYNAFIDNLFVGIIYTQDILNYADDFVSLYNSGQVEEEKMYWRILLGRVVYKNAYSIDRIIADIDDHFVSCDSYMDSLIIQKLQDSGIVVEDFFDLIAVVLQQYNSLLTKDYNNDIHSRYLDILYYLLYDFILGFNRVILNLNKRSARKDIVLREFKKIWSNDISAKKIFSLVRSQATNLAVVPANATSDSKYLPVTCILEDQNWSLVA